MLIILLSVAKTNVPFLAVGHLTAGPREPVYYLYVRRRRGERPVHARGDDGDALVKRPSVRFRRAPSGTPVQVQRDETAAEISSKHLATMRTRTLLQM